MLVKEVYMEEYGVSVLYAARYRYVWLPRAWSNEKSPFWHGDRRVYHFKHHDGR